MSWTALIPAALSLLSGAVGSQQKAPDYGLSASQINNLIDKYRRSGLEGIKQMGIQERQDASSRLAASGLTPNIGMQQALYNPILQALSGSRAKLEGNLAGAEGNLLSQQAAGQQRADLANFGNQTDFWSGLSDLFGTGTLYGLESGAFGDLDQWLSKLLSGQSTPDTGLGINYDYNQQRVNNTSPLNIR